MILQTWYSPPLAGDVALCGATWTDSDGRQCIGQALILDGAIIYDHVDTWPVEVLEAVVAQVPDWQIDEKWGDV